jgi:transcriptional regulator with XRE-family HTH domain
MAEETAKVVALGERLRQHRAERGLSQAQAARELEVARTAYRLWELEAAKPSPDRWRLIARWLGVSISTMLLGADLIDEEDAEAAELITARASREGNEAWDDISAQSAGDFFEQERSTIARQTLTGKISAAESGQLTASLDRMLETMQGREATITPAPGVFRKALVGDSSAPELARTALVVTAAGVDQSVVERAELLTSELVTNSVERNEGAMLSLAITLLPDVLRVEVTDASAGAEGDRPRDQRMRWSFAITAELASRWGAGREGGVNVSWFEIDISSG